MVKNIFIVKLTILELGKVLYDWLRVSCLKVWVEGEEILSFWWLMSCAVGLFLVGEAVVLHACMVLSTPSQSLLVPTSMYSTSSRLTDPIIDITTSSSD